MTDGMQATVRTGWRLAASRRAEGAVATLDLPVSTYVGPAALGLDGRGDHHLLLPVDDDHAVVEDGRSAHVRVDTRLLVVDGRRRRFVDVVCHRPDLFEVFDEMVVALLQGIGETPSGVGEVVERVLQQWRELLRPSAGILGERELRGLIGELLVLELLADAGLVGAVERVWTGPDRAPHDFTLGRRRRVEVKTVGVRGSMVKIHGLDQLHPSRDRDLVLALVRLEPAADGRSLPDVVDTLQTLVGDRVGLRRQLAKAGYAETDADRYRDRRYVQSNLYAWSVGVDFPRLDVDSFKTVVPDEVAGVEYELDLAGLTPYAATDRAAGQLICTGSVQ
ncbi:PD-(D/E)XK motif protein [Actinoplanes sp. NEAU-A12]|uniref:PD-(D/E)XK motif protein n=1 Tax=Actinoplanes sandaracinus TaxID=3045177 RepID=A0ABT6WHN5_9ACTN|nr:PD-(D/E)XK motif protein [Actinoplanes sandaracinus]MDI6099234.1 PD-(D/E)XK motif protein [Actinoplanes sandaracinus]